MRGQYRSLIPETELKINPRRKDKNFGWLNGFSYSRVRKCPNLQFRLTLEEFCRPGFSRKGKAFENSLPGVGMDMSIKGLVEWRKAKSSSMPNVLGMWGAEKLRGPFDEDLKYVPTRSGKRAEHTCSAYPCVHLSSGASCTAINRAADVVLHWLHPFYIYLSSISV